MRYLAMVAAGLAALLTTALGASASQRTTPVARVGGLGLIAPHVGDRIVGHFRAPRTSSPAPAAAATIPPPNVRDNLTYNGGPVMRTNTIYAIYWVPSGYSQASNYRSTVDGYFQAVAADSGQGSNVYSATTQYSDTTGSIAYDSTFGGSAVDTDSFPTSGCTLNSYTDFQAIGVTNCLSDSQLQSEIRSFADSKGWPHGPNTEFFLYTPKNVGSCLPDSHSSTGQDCSYTEYCAYHSAFFNGGENPSNEYIYANMPWPNQTVDIEGTEYVSDCWSGNFPNSPDVSNYDLDAADEVINVSSHEHNESVTDPLGTAWWVNTPTSNYENYEDGDLCVWYFAKSANLGGSTSAWTAYNQVIDGSHYFVQGEWSNKTATAAGNSGCVWKYLKAPVNTSPPSISGTATVGQTLTGSAGSWLGPATSYKYTWLRCDNAGANCATAKTVTSTATTSTYTLVSTDDKHTMRLAVNGVDSAGTSVTATSSATGVVNGEPVNSGAPSISGTATVGQTLTGQAGSWTLSPTGYQYQWLRCDNAGNNCTLAATVKATATSSTYRLVTADDKHTIKLSVIAANAAGTSSPATTSATSIVGGEPENTGAPSITGTAAVGQTLTGQAGTWTNSPKLYHYQWLRCNSLGASCSAITTVNTAATTSTYKLVTADKTHTIKLSVTATNAAGTGDPAVTGPTSVVS
jgi:hypothetical protein